MTTTPAPTDIDTLKALTDSHRPCTCPVDRPHCACACGSDNLACALARPLPWAPVYVEPHETWIVFDFAAEKVAECFDGQTAELIAAARNALPALLDELAETRAELDEAKREVWALNNSDDGRVVLLESELNRMTGVAKALRITVAEMLSGKQHTRARTLTWESTLKYATEALANPATTAEPAACICATWREETPFGLQTVTGPDATCLVHGEKAEPADEPKADAPDWVTVLDDAIAASGARLVFDPRNWTAPHTLHGPKATDPAREHPAHVGQTCDEYEAEPAAG